MRSGIENDSLRQTIANALHNEKTLAGYGRSQHGLNGKDADLDDGGQCVVKGLCVYDDKNGTWIEAILDQYANVCPESDDENEERDEKLQEKSEAIAMQYCCYSCEWSGDYWTFRNDGVKVRCPLTEQEYENDGKSQYFINRIAARLMKAINANPAVRGFEKMMTSLNEEMNGLHKEFPESGQGDIPPHQVEGSHANFDRYIAGDR